MPNNPRSRVGRAPPKTRSRNALVLLTVLALGALYLPQAAPLVEDGPLTGDRLERSGGSVGPMSPGPDLNASGSDISLSDTTPRHGQSIQLTLAVRNTGSDHALNVTALVYDGDNVTGTLIDSFYIANASAGSTTGFGTTWTAVIGDRTLSLYLDTGDNVTEDSEANNIASRDVTVSGVPDGRLEPGAFLLSTTLEGSITLTADAFNGGNATASGYRVGFYSGDPDAGGSLIGRQSLTDVVAGGRVTAQQTWSAVAGGYHLYARLENTDPLDPSGNDQVDREVQVRDDIVARAGPDQVGWAGMNLTFNGSRSWSAGGAITNYTWDMADGTTAYGAVVVHNYTNTGSTARVLTVRLTVKDGQGGSASDTARVYINPQGSSPPVADAGTPPAGLTLEDLVFNGSMSSGNISSYRWDLGDGSRTTGSQVTHSYSDDGTYPVSLVVVSTDQLADADLVQATVSNRPPEVEPIDDEATDVGTPVQLLVLAVDVDGYIASYAWDFGDGQGSNARDPSHTWASDGPHTVTVNVTDDDGATATVTLWVNVTNVVPLADFIAPSIVSEGDPVQVDASSTVEPGGDIVLYEWDWESDGTYDNTTGPVSSATFLSPGYYNITLRVTDGEGTSNLTTRQVRVLDVAPQARGTVSPFSSMEGLQFTFNASRSTEPGDDIVQYSWDFEGDGEWDLNTTEVEVKRVMTEVGRFYPRLMVIDEDGSSDVYWYYWFRYTVTNAVPLVNETESFGDEGENTTVHADVYEPGDDLVAFQWDFDLDGIIDAVTEEPHANHTWWMSGVFEVWINATDEDHTDDAPSWGAGLVTVNISDVAPKPFIKNGQASEGEVTQVTVELLGTEQNISRFMVDTDGDGETDVESSTRTIDLVFTRTKTVNCTVTVVDTDGTEGFARFTMFVHDVAPVVLGPPFLVVVEGHELQVAVTAIEPGDDIVRYEFDWEANGLEVETSDEPNAVHVYDSPGAKRIMVSAIDVDGSRGSLTIQVLVANSLPVAEITTPGQPTEGQDVNLSAIGSSEPGGHIVSYEWDYDGDGLFDHATRDPWHFHAWDVPGSYNLVLRVTDADGTFDEDMTYVEVLGADPVAALDVLLRPEDTPSLLDASGSKDPGGIVLYQWNITSPGLTSTYSTSTPYLEYTFDRKVQYDILLIVTDGEGVTGSYQVSVSKDDVKTLPPAVSWQAPTSILEGEPVLFQAWADDPFPADEELLGRRTIDFRWTFGDGIVGSGPEVTHVYKKALGDPVQVRLTVTDEDDDQTTVLVANLTIRNPPPVVLPVDTLFVEAGGSGSIAVSATDATSEPEEMGYELASPPEWVRMDGSELVAEPGGDVRPATYMVTVRVIDVLGAETTVQVPVVVTSGVTVSGVSWAAFLAILVPLLIVVLVLAVVIASRMRPTGAAEAPGAVPPDDERKPSEYDALFEGPPRKVRAVSKVEPGRVEVDTSGEEEAPGIPAPEPEPEPEEPPLPSWITPSEAEAEPGGEVEEGEFALEEKVVEAPPATPSEWATPPEPARDRPYRYRRGPKEGVAYKGARPPRR